MATQPRFPRDPGQRPGRPELVPPAARKPSKRPGNLRITIVAAVIATVVFAVILHFLRRGPERSAPVSSGALMQLPNNHELQVGSMQITSSASSDALTLAGQVTNTGNRKLNGGQVQLAFRDEKGNTIETVDRPIAGLSGGNCEVTNEFAQQPIKPNDLRFFCVTVPRVPSDWNHEPPDVTVVTVSSPD